MKIRVQLFLLFLISAQVHGAGPFCVAHRSLGFGGLENSLEAFKSATQANATAIEFDLQHTQDNQTIVYHDEVLERLVKGSKCSKGKLVKELSLTQIRQNCLLKNGEAIPTFEETLQLLSQSSLTLFVELKDSISNSDLLLLKKYYLERPDKIIIISFEPLVLDKVLERRKQDAFYKQIKVILLKKYGYFGSLRKYDGIDAKYIDRLRVKRLQRRGKLVGVYTKNSNKKIKKYLRKGVDFITTNKPSLCQKAISN